jgi:hypothetical protein
MKPTKTIPSWLDRGHPRGVPLVGVWPFGVLCVLQYQAPPHIQQISDIL